MSVNTQTKNGLADLLTKHEARLVGDWIKEQASLESHRGAARQSLSFGRNAPNS